MRVPLEWLEEYCFSGLDAERLAERLAMTGTEVERVEHHGVGALEHFVVGRVLERHKHPDADRLSVCMVDTGGSAAAQIVCGAPNVAAGQTVAVARPGAIMPDGTTLQKARLRGQISDGMILAEDEVAIGTDHEGIMVLADELEPGTPLERVLPISTEVLVLEITPNRPDCLGIYGVAREVHAATGAALKPPPWLEDPGSAGSLDAVQITVQDPELCPRFTARVLDGVALGPSPFWLKARLMAAGQRPISNVVDITNYVMLLTGQPMHAFDLDRVAGARLNVRHAHPDEPVRTLDGQTRALDERMLVIEDAEGPTSIAGVMGGARSEVTASTTRLLSEAATWNGANIHRTSLKLGLRSEASARFEKQIQPEQAPWAQAVACRLLIELCGASLRPGTIDVGGDGPPPATIRLRDARVSGLLGAEVPRERSRAILESLDFTVADAPDGLDVTVPPLRRDDVTREADLIEEVSRLGGAEIPATLPATRHSAAAALSVGGGRAGTAGPGRLTPRQRQRRRASDVLASLGLHEVVGWSFAGAADVARLRLGAGGAVMLANPMSAQQAQLRTTLLGSLLDVAARNRAHGAGAVRIFEAGAVYLPDGRDGELPREPHRVAALLSGPVRPPTWRSPDPPGVDLYAAKGVLAALLDALAADWEVQPGARPFLHPGRAAAVLVGGAAVGWVGELHPSVAAQWGIDDAVAGFELDLDDVGEPEPAVYRDVTTFPEVREDLAVVVAESVAAADVLAVARAAGAPLLGHVEIFDVYRDPAKLGAGNVSLALRLAYRAGDRTLTDAEVARQRQSIALALERQLGGRIRAA
jgi:phenylalanyl-tRNA synthetase beta chain